MNENRRMAEAAHRAATQRLADLTRDAPRYRATRNLVRYWADRLAELERG